MGPNTANSQYLDVYMEGTVDGWLAVGFSLDQAMVSAVRMKHCFYVYSKTMFTLKSFAYV